MKIKIQKSNDLITEPLDTYIEEKLLPLGKFIKHFDTAGEAELWLEISRTTNHHKKGDVYMAAADLKLPHKVLRGEATADNIRTAIDQVRDRLHAEIEKYKTQNIEHKRGGKEK